MLGKQPSGLSSSARLWSCLTCSIFMRKQSIKSRGSLGSSVAWCFRMCSKINSFTLSKFFCNLWWGPGTASMKEGKTAWSWKAKQSCFNQGLSQSTRNVPDWSYSSQGLNATCQFSGKKREPSRNNVHRSARLSHSWKHKRIISMHKRIINSRHLAASLSSFWRHFKKQVLKIAFTFWKSMLDF